MKKVLFFTLACCFGFAHAQIQLDNQFLDWSNLPHITSDGGVFVSGSITSNADWLFIHVELTEEIGLDENVLPNELRLLLDLDNDTNTGVDYAQQGLGVDLLINWADRQAIRYTNGSGIESFNEVGILCSPTYSSTEFELAFRRETTQAVGPFINVKWYDGESQTGFPENGFLHVLNETAEPWIPVSIARAPGTLNRVAFWNMNGRMDQGSAQAAMERILQAVSPDIIGFSEVANVSANFVQNLLNDWIPIGDGASWQVVKDDYDLMVASKDSILSSHPFVTRQFPVLLEAHPDWQVPMLFTSSHMKCCGGANNEAQRQAEADEYMAFLRNSINGEGELAPDLSANAPILYGGDLNMVGLDDPINTLLTGDISNETAHGPDFEPDWDGTSLTEYAILQSDHPVDYTWMSSSLSSEWMPGKLDYIIASDATVSYKGGFSIRTAEMSADRLTELGLQAGDALAASDHFIIVADIGLGDLIGYIPDTDGDGITDDQDNCLLIANSDQYDFNNDGVGDVCSDIDGDGLSDALEIELYNSDPLSSDTDGDGISDGLELCNCASINQCPGDLTNDNVVSVGDLLTLLGLFGATC